MSVIIDPAELAFKRPFNREVCQILQLSNENSDAVVFKVKTTAPKHYCVRPNSGRIEPGKTVEVQVLLQAMKEEPADDAKCKDKFLVQTVSVTREMEFANVTSIFEKASKSAIQERKIRVNWLPAGDSPVVEQGAELNGASIIEDEPPAYTSPNANFQTPAVGAPKPGSDTSPIPPPDFRDKPKREISAQQTAESPASPAVSSTVTDLKSQLSDAKTTIQNLKDRLADQGLRQRKIGGETEKSGAPLAQQQTQAGDSGVPVQLVAGLCLLSFLIAYFLF
ncbi:phosphatidylinositol-binding protein scs2 [Aspergillus nanangensis]|uniref:Phosphatidylinositol-binding protein scs2 n=1 Tax=Aspergillus nanangensis TaxID=2582783 RepID=A0AAD4CJW1_ASPNN|nr:phosphatidylinositol-binding protein scs2 [Aspergillus nanangensis]